MESDLERRFTRIESKINLIARAVGFILAFVLGVGTFFIAGRTDPWAPIYAVSAGLFAGAVYEWHMRRHMRRLEQWFPYDQDD